MMCHNDNLSQVVMAFNRKLKDLFKADASF